MAMTKAEAAKLTQDLLLRGVIETIIKESQVLQLLPFMEVTGTAVTYNREATLPAASFYNVGDTWTEATPTFTSVTAALKIMGGDADVDNFLQATYADPNDLPGQPLHQVRGTGDRREALDDLFFDVIGAEFVQHAHEDRCDGGPFVGEVMLQDELAVVPGCHQAGCAAQPDRIRHRTSLPARLDAAGVAAVAVGRHPQLGHRTILSVEGDLRREARVFVVPAGQERVRLLLGELDRDLLLFGVLLDQPRQVVGADVFHDLLRPRHYPGTPERDSASRRLTLA
jgi:hypothetical protein